MSRIYDWTLIIVISLIAFATHTITIELFGPQSALHEQMSMAAKFNAAQKADLWFEILAVWIEVIAIAGIIVWALAREYRRQTTGVVRRAPR